MPAKKKTEQTIEIPISQIPDFLQKQATENKESLADVTANSLKDGFLVIYETAKGKSSLEVVDLFPSSFKLKDKPSELLKEYRRLREKFAPVGGAIDYLKDQILGYGVDAGINDLKDEEQKKIRDWVRQMVENVHQDIIAYSLTEILDIMVDEALTVGAAGAEIVYEKDIIFENYVEDVVETKTTKGIELTYTLREPDWENDENLGGIKRLKILDNSIERLKPHRHPVSWDISFWTLDEATEEPLITGGVVIPKKSKDARIIKYHPWEIFWLVLNRRKNTPIGESVIAQVYEMAITLERIQKAIGEGLYRAGNKKYFIICGTEKRPWGEPHIRNFMKQLKEMAEKGWGNLPVPAGFDIKEIGGEVFEGKDITDHFVTMIAFGLGVPKDIVANARGKPSDMAAMASSMKVIRRRLSLARVIQRQLFSRHVWCKFGKEKTKQGGKSTDTIWVPPVLFVKQDFITTKDRLEQIYKGLNVANPLFPELTLEMNRELARLYGYECILPTQEEFKEMQEEMAKQAQKAEKKSQKPEMPPEVKPKSQGQPEPPSREKQEKRLKAGVNKSRGSKGESKPLGLPRTPKEAKVEETAKTNVEETAETPEVEVAEKPTFTGEEGIDEDLTLVWDRTVEPQELRKRRIKMVLDSQKEGKVITHPEIDKIFAEEKLLAEKIKTENKKQKTEEEKQKLINDSK